MNYWVFVMTFFSSISDLIYWYVNNKQRVTFYRFFLCPITISKRFVASPFNLPISLSLSFFCSMCLPCDLRQAWLIEPCAVMMLCAQVLRGLISWSGDRSVGASCNDVIRYNILLWTLFNQLVWFTFYVCYLFIYNYKDLFMNRKQALRPTGCTLELMCITEYCQLAHGAYIIYRTNILGCMKYIYRVRYAYRFS